MTFEQFLRDFSEEISIAMFVFIAIILLIYLLIPILKKRKAKAPEVKKVDEDEFNLALGGKDNIKAVSLNGSRLSVELVDMKKFDREKLKELGVVRVIVMQTKLILLVDERFQKLVK